jgi:hypothetical protein
MDVLEEKGRCCRRHGCARGGTTVARRFRHATEEGGSSSAAQLHSGTGNSDSPPLAVSTHKSRCGRPLGGGRALPPPPACSSTFALPPRTESSAPPWEGRGALPQNVGNRRPASSPPPSVLRFSAMESWCDSIPVAATNAFSDPESASASGLLCRGRRERRSRAGAGERSRRDKGMAARAALPREKGAEQRRFCLTFLETTNFASLIYLLWVMQMRECLLYFACSCWS